jgi:multidrug resistance protein, MATE family
VTHPSANAVTAEPLSASRPEAPRALPSTLVSDPGQDARVLIFEPVLLRRIVSLGLPVIIGMLTQALINQVDTIFVGRLDERTAVAGTAALGFSLTLLWAFGGFLAAIAVGTQALTARRFGEGDVEGAGKVLTNSVTLAIGSSIVVTALAIAAVPAIFERLHNDPYVRELGISFCRIRFLGILAMVLTSSLKSFYDGVGRVRVHMIVAILMNILNALLCWLLVFGNLGFPRLEVEGAAWAAVLSASAGAVMMLGWALRGEDRAAFRAFRVSNLDAKVAGTVARLSVFSGLATLFVMTGFGIFFAIVGKIDERDGLAGVNVSATQLIISVCMVIFMTSIAFGTSTATLVSQSMGARKPELAARYGWQSVLVMVLFMSAVGLLIATFPEPILRIFLPQDASRNELLKDEVIAIATNSLRFCGLIAPIAAGALVLTQALYGAGESRFVMIAEGILHFTCLVPLAYFFAIGLDFGLIGCWYATACYGLALLVATGWKFWSGSWKKTVL